ncbi:MAG: SLBB domain-containing protein, partial [Candidatus Neomarinimicrobiota bacterium]
MDYGQTLSAQNEVQSLESSAQSFSLEAAIDPSTYILGAGDELGLNILISENITWLLKITPTGDFFIPSVGAIHIAGLTLTNATEKIVDFIKSQAYPNAKVTVALINLREFQIQVVGAVNKPGFVTVSPIDRLSSVVEKAGGFHQFAQEFNISVTSPDRLQSTINFFEYLYTGNLKHNPTFTEGAVINIPFGNVEKEGIVVRGSVVGRGYDIIQKGETLKQYFQRKTKFNDTANLESVTITRNESGTEEYITVSPREFETTVLHAGDIIDVLTERGVMVNGFVQAPGAYQFYPGFSIIDYVSMAGGNTPDGDPNKCF